MRLEPEIVWRAMGYRVPSCARQKIGHLNKRVELAVLAVTGPRLSVHRV